MESERVLFRPKPSENQSISPEDIKYAQAFEDVDRCINASRQPESLALRLSTCRNAYLTINALFVDVQQIIGHGSLPSTLSRAIEHLRRREPNESNALLDKIRMVLNVMKSKRDVWERRDGFDRELAAYMDGLTRLERDRLRSLLNNVRTSSKGQSWHSKYYELSSSEPAHITKLLQVVDAMMRTTDAVASAARAISRLLASEANLFEKDSENSWLALVTTLTKEADALQIATSPSGDAGPTVTWRDQAGQLQNIGSMRPECDAASAICESLAMHLAKVVRGLYDELAGTFVLNEALPKLPHPFRIDVAEPQLDDRADRANLSVRIEDFGERRPSRVRVALLDCGVPLAHYNARTLDYADETHRTEVNRLAEAAIAAAAAAEANLLVFPELFLPKNHAHRIADAARSRNLVLVAGEEGQPAVYDGQLVNHAGIVVPGRSKTYYQRKLRRSPYEPPLTAGDSLTIFDGTPIGTFAVLVCSDFLEFDLVTALADAPALLDFLIVTALNPHTELFERLAVADACRLYCHVIIANNSSPEATPSAASAAGTLICSPRNILADMIRPLSAPVSLGLPKVGGVEPGVRLHDVSLEELLPVAGKPHKGYLAAPHYRGRPR